MQFISNNALELFNEATKATLTHSVNLWEKQVDALKENVNRNLNRVVAFKQPTSAEEALQYQRQIGEEELAEWKKTGEACYEIANAAKQDWINVANKGRDLMERGFNDAVEKTAAVFPNGKPAFFSETTQNTAKAISDFFQNSVNLTNQAINNGVQDALKASRAAAKPAKKR